MAGSREMTVAALLEKIATFPGPSEPPVNVGGRWYPRSKSDDVPTLVHEAAARLRRNPGGFRVKLNASDEASLIVALDKLRMVVWPSRIGDETSRYHAAVYIEAWAEKNGLTLPAAPPVKERHR